MNGLHSPNKSSHILFFKHQSRHFIHFLSKSNFPHEKTNCLTNTNENMFRKEFCLNEKKKSKWNGLQKFGVERSFLASLTSLHAQAKC